MLEQSWQDISSGEIKVLQITLMTLGNLTKKKKEKKNNQRQGEIYILATRKEIIYRSGSQGQ